MFSLEPRCQGLCGSQKYTGRSVAKVISAWRARGAGVRLVGLTTGRPRLSDHASSVGTGDRASRERRRVGREGVVKPDRAIFKIVLERHDLRPEATVFVDDSPANVAGAESVGIRGVLFTDAAQLRADLVQLGFLRDAPGHQNGGSAG
ncbi:HAD family hydrolase [Georgenia sp. SUBG003]|uniref:HAD family hydrolase n=1 Tax=Georgenia sp. SUBG003 TaxID=1497974 RepID=UPI003AB85B20